MGNDTSSPSTSGFRVLSVQRDSPGATSGLVSYFDFILAANGHRLEEDDETFTNAIRESEDADMVLSVYNVKACTVREVVLRPTRKWKGRGLLGITIRFDSFQNAEACVLHVLDVAEGSPAEEAGLKGNGDDYILGTSRSVIRNATDLSYAAEDKADEGAPLILWTYNKKTDMVRQVSLWPRDDWGGPGCIGCEIGSGYLHVLPAECRKTLGTAAFVDGKVGEKAKVHEDATIESKMQNVDEDVGSDKKHNGVAVSTGEPAVDQTEK